MSTESAKALVRQVVDDWNKADLDALDEHLDPATYVNRDPNNPEVTDFASYKRWAAAARAAFPDLHVTIDDLIAEGDKVVGRFTCSGSHLGEWLGHAPTGRRFEKIDEVYIFRIREGRIVHAWGIEDTLARLEQLGLR